MINALLAAGALLIQSGTATGASSDSRVIMDQKASLSVPLVPIASSNSVPKDLESIAKDHTLVLFFFNETCGVTIFYKKRLEKVIEEFQGSGVEFVGIRTGLREAPLAPLDLPEPKYLPIPFFDDTSGAMRREFNVQASMTFAVLDKQRVLRYFGGFDDQVTESRVQQHFLEDALTNLVQGREVRVKRGRALGCAIMPEQR